MIRVFPIPKMFLLRFDQLIITPSYNKRTIQLYYDYYLELQTGYTVFYIYYILDLRATV